LTVGESFPLETRAMVIAIFYSLGTAIGGVAGSILFGALIASGSRVQIMWGYELAGALALAAAITELAIGLKAERVSLEEIAPPLSRMDD
jgi:MFS family permease